MSEANDVGSSGEINSASCPATTDVSLPIQAYRGSTQADESGVHAVVGAGKASTEIEVDIGACVGTKDLRPEGLQAQDGLPQRASNGT